MFHRLLLAWMLCLGLAAQDAVIVFLRHAEKASRRTNAELSASGKQRALRLVEELSPFQPVALYASNLRRTQQTLEPLSRQLHLPLQIYERGQEWALGRSLLARHPGQTVVVCGHSDTLMDLVKALGLTTPFPEISGFDRFWMLRHHATSGTVTLEEHRQRPAPSEAKGTPAAVRP
ncbi:MAG: histidine phosphatase family protein [Holophagaceae bacterium]|uniref:Histidine phosphatase family protein n=1 Tax=Candidatus Geothrix skivensis TaxID=2954439 RepID=A0A9D7XJV4_9BACT|nr:histidine phosphatase family protein [Candidatus Geothrix skivensis]